VSGCTLEFGQHVILTANGGTPDVEYALFDPGEIQLQAAGLGTIREVGYQTTVAAARARLAELNVTAGVAEEAAEAAMPAVARAYARGPSVRSIVDRLQAAELFEGRTFEASTGRYTGLWLDLPALGTAIDIKRAPAIIQALHLAAVLSERADAEPVTLTTFELTAALKRGERTFKRVLLESPDVIVQALRTLQPATLRPGADTGPGRQEIAERLRERALLAPRSSYRLAAIEATLAEREIPARGPLADPELWALDGRLSAGEVERVVGELDGIERRRGRLPGTAYLRARAALIARSEEPREVAERVDALSTSLPAFYELELLAAQAWVAAGDTRRAKAFARDLLDNKNASDAVRIRAREVLAAASLAPPDARAASSGSLPTIPKAPRAPSGTEIQGPTRRRSVAESRARSSTRSSWPVAPESAREPGVAAPAPPYRVETLGERTGSPPPRNGEGERLERLGTPPGAEDRPLPPSDDRPRDPAAARLAFTFLARELGREVRLRDGIELHADVAGLEVAQRLIREKLPDGRIRTAEDERELMRLGSFLSELLARRLGARWVDLESDDRARWAMIVPSGSLPDQVARCWPFARVLRFIAMGHKERDLVSYYLELEARAR
jgi:hypothetical protein